MFLDKLKINLFFFNENKIALYIYNYRYLFAVKVHLKNCINLNIVPLFLCIFYLFKNICIYYFYNII